MNRILRNQKSIIILFPILFFSGVSHLYSQKIQSGPMLGYCEMREVLLWVQTDIEANVKFSYYPLTASGQIFYTEEIKTKKSNAFTAKLAADQVLPGVSYGYDVWLNGKKQKLSYPTTFTAQTLWQYRFPAPDFTFAVGSCAYVNDAPYDRPGKPYGGDYQIYKTIYQKAPNFMLWLGDNTYLREGDWNTKTGIQYRYTHTRSLPELQPLLANTHHYATWDDHDFGPNDSDKGFFNKVETLKTFENFWGNLYYGTPQSPGVFNTFQWNDVDFILCDNRMYRTNNSLGKDPSCTLLGKEQLQWLKDKLLASKAPFKIVAMGGQFVSTFAKFENYINACPSERDSIIAFIVKNKISGVVFLSGDRHISEVNKLDLPEGYPLYDITSSPLGAGSTCNDKDADATTYVQGSRLCGKRNFAFIKVSGGRGERTLTSTFIDADGTNYYTFSVSEKDLKFKK